MSALEATYGITYAEVGIDDSRCRPSSRGECKIRCHKCHDSHSPANQRTAKDLQLNVKLGAWVCFRCGEKGSLENEARKRDGWKPAIRSNRPMISAKQETPIYTATPVAEIHTSHLAKTLEPWAVDWHRDRGIPQAALEAFGVGSKSWTDAAGNEVQAIHYPYYVDGELVNAKVRRMPKVFTQIEGGSKALYNIDQAEGNDVLVMAEGELDTIACHVAGWVAVSLPNGAPGKIQDKVTGDWKVSEAGRKLEALSEAKSARVLAAASRIVIATDDDMEGQALKRALVEKLGPLRCWEIPAWPDGCKDPNDVLQQHGAQALNLLIESAHPVPMPGIASFSTEREALQHIYEFGYDRGVESGWERLDQLFRARRGTVTGITGIPSNGKTSLLHALCCKITDRHKWKWGIFSPESGDNGALFGKLVQIISDAQILPDMPNRMNQAQLDAAAEYVENHFWRVDAARDADEGYGVVTIPEIIDRLTTLVLRHGIQGAVIDPWNRLEAVKGAGMTETEYVAWAINQLSRFAIRHNVAVFVVAHPHKMDPGKDGEEEPMPSPYNISGSAHWYNMCDNILGIRRNKYEEPLNLTQVRVWKTREEGTSGGLGMVNFYYDGNSRRYYEDPEQISVRPGQQSFAPVPSLPRLVSASAQPAPWEGAMAAD